MSLAEDPTADTKRTRRTPADEHARRLAAETLAKGETQATAAKVAGVHVRTLRRWAADPAFGAAVAEASGSTPTAPASELSEIRRQLWHLAKTGTATARIQALKALREADGEDAGTVDWAAVVSSVGDCPPDARARLLGRLCQLEARDRSANQLLVARCTGLEVEPVVADRVASAWSQPGPELLAAIGEQGVARALEAHARQLEAHHRARD